MLAGMCDYMNRPPRSQIWVCAMVRLESDAMFSVLTDSLYVILAPLVSPGPSSSLPRSYESSRVTNIIISASVVICHSLSPCSGLMPSLSSSVSSSCLYTAISMSRAVLTCDRVKIKYPEIIISVVVTCSRF